MAHMNSQFGSAPVSLLPLADQERLMREAFAIQNFPPAYPRPSRVVLKDQGPDQRGFIIGGERL